MEKISIHTKIFARQFSIYAKNRVYGGHEEGGWWYNSYEFIRPAEFNELKNLRTSTFGRWIVDNIDSSTFVFFEKRQGENITGNKTYQ